MTAAARRTVPRARGGLFPRSRIDGPLIIAFRLAAAVGADHFIGLRFDELFKFFTAFLAFVL